MKNDFLKLDFDLYNERQLMALLTPLNSSLNNSSSLSQAILQLSEIYNSGRGGPSIWDDKDLCAAYFSYYMPLNYMRCLYAIQKIPKGLRLSTSLVDYGSGLGAASFALNSLYHEKKFFLFEPSKSALNQSRRLSEVVSLKNQFEFVSNEKNLKSQLKKPFDLFLSYSLNEMSQLPDLAQEAENIFILEPSTREAGRKLQALRQSLIQNGYSVWAPCLHQFDCPLLTQSKTDWCHTRMHISMPSWFKKIENHLPMKNNSLTLSYLIVSRQTPKDYSELTLRVIGDTLFEKGKTRQSVCRNSNREYLTWMTKSEEAPLLPRGEVVVVESELELKSNELRSLPPFKYKIDLNT